MNITSCHKCGICYSEEEYEGFSTLEFQCPLCNLADKIGYKINIDDGYYSKRKEWVKDEGKE